MKPTKRYQLSIQCLRKISPEMKVNIVSYFQMKLIWDLKPVDQHWNKCCKDFFKMKGDRTREKPERAVIIKEYQGW